jgi:hypothetical protein
LGSEKAVRLGRAAHITAAAENGPRYDDALSAEQRRGFSNGIWLCTDHADEIDANRDRFPADLLREWKARAESLAEEEIGKALPLKTDAIDQVLAILGQAPSRFVPDAIKNTHTAIAEALHKLDPDVEVTTEFADGETRYYLNARRDLEVMIEGAGEAGARLHEALSSVLRDGAEITIPMEGLTVTGSKVFELLMKAASSLTVGAAPLEATLRLTCHDAVDVPLVIELHGEARMGGEAATIDVVGLGGVIRMNLLLPYRDAGPEQSWTTNFDFAPWENCPVADVPHFERGQRLIKALTTGTPTTLEVEIDGRCMFQAASMGPREQKSIEQVDAMFRYIDSARTVSKFTGTAIITRVASISSAEAKRVFDLADVLSTLSQPRRLTVDDAISIQMDADSAAELAVDGPGPHMFKVEAPQHTVHIFQQPVVVPALTTILSFVDLSIHQRETRKLTRGAIVTVQVTPTDASMMTSWLT